MATAREGEIDEGRRELLKLAAAGGVTAALGADVSAQSQPAAQAQAGPSR